MALQCTTNLERPPNRGACRMSEPTIDIVTSVIVSIDSTLKDISGTQITPVSDMTNVLLDIRSHMMTLREREVVNA